MAEKPTILVLAPMPALPASAGNRRRLVATCASLLRGGFAIDFAYYAHEDQIYRRFGQHPPTDLDAMQAAFRRVFLIEPRGTIRLTTRATHFGIDDWCPDEVGDFVAWYFSQYPQTGAILVNYVFLARALERVPAGVLKLIDTHDRFAGRRNQYRPFRAEPNFFYTDEAGEAEALSHTDIVLAIQPAEAKYFAGITNRTVHLLPPHVPPQRTFRAPERIARIGFLGHGNDPNVFSIDAFARAWAEGWTPERPELLIAGEICKTAAAAERPGVRPLGFVASVEDFYDAVDVVVAPMLMGSGLKMKVAEALSFGVPVIGTAIGFEGFDPADPAHRCRDAEETKARVLALANDAEGLAALTKACADLFAGYNAASLEAERVLLALLRAHPSRGSVPPVQDAQPSPEPRRTERSGPLLLTGESSSRLLPSHDAELGALVATERRPGDGTGASYAPSRRRWFARSADPAGADAPVASLDGRALALSPEWVRERALPAPVRARLARALAASEPDWKARGSVIGAGNGIIEIAFAIPAFLARGSRPAAAFLVPADGAEATELRLERVTPLQLRESRCANAAGRMPPPIPASIGFRCEGTARLGPGDRLLLLTDDAIGRVTLAAIGEAALP